MRRRRQKTQAELLRSISDSAFELIKMIELELSGIRDGDGHWHRAGNMEAPMSEIIDMCEEWLRGRTFPVSEEERKRLEHMRAKMLTDPNADPWDIWRCQQALDGRG